MKILINKQLILESGAKKRSESNNVPCNGIKKKMGFSCKQDKDGKVFIATHRARSKSYDSFDKIPMKDITFIDSTG